MDLIKRTTKRIDELQGIIIDFTTGASVSFAATENFQIEKTELMKLYGLNVALLETLNGGQNGKTN